MKILMNQQAAQFIQTAGVTGFVSGVQTGMVPQGQALTAYATIGAAIDTYVNAVPQDHSLDGLLNAIRHIPAKKDIAPNVQSEILEMLVENRRVVELAVQLAARIDAIGDAVIDSAITVHNRREILPTAPDAVTRPCGWVAGGPCGV